MFTASLGFRCSSTGPPPQLQQPKISPSPMSSRRQNYLPTSLHMRTSALTSPERKTAGNGVKLQIITNEQLLLHRGLKRIPYSRIGQSQAERGKNDYHHLQNIAWNCLVVSSPSFGIMSIELYASWIMWWFSYLAQRKQLCIIFSDL